MLSKEDNELITNTDAGTAMGDLFRRFWLPACLAEELPGLDCVPVRIKLLNEDLIAFRDSDGRVGLIDAFCPHRGAPMFFGRNEESGLRCIYHGWKFDVQGVCVDLPNAPEGVTYKEKIRTLSYPVVEAGGLIWAYMGPPEKQPPFPDFEWTKLPSPNIYVTKFIVECNYLQAMEGDYDPSHARFLHSTLDGNRNPTRQTYGRHSDVNSGFNRIRPGYDRQTFDSMEDRRVTVPPPDVIQDSDSGVWFITAAEQPDGSKAAYALPWLMPIFTLSGAALSSNTYSSNMRVPIDNRSIMFYRLRWSYQPLPEEEVAEYRHGGFTHPELIPGTWQTKANIHNDYEVDRISQRYYTFSGIKSFPIQDSAMIESQWGPIADRSREHLTSLDHRIIYLRRRLLDTAKALVKGTEPSEPWHPEAYSYHRESVVLQDGTLDAAIEQVKAKASRSRLAAEIEKASRPVIQ